MSLPPWLRGWWPALKRIHLLATRVSGYAYRAMSPVLGPRGVPRTATAASVDTAASEPATVTLHPGRPSTRLTRSATTGDPAGHPIFEQAVSASIPATFVLEVRGGSLAGDFGATVTPGKILDHETSTYFGVVDWRDHPVFLRPTLGRREHVAGTVLSLTTRGTAINYYHFLYDAIARFGILKSCLPDEQIDAVIVPHATRYQRQLLELAGVPGRLIQPERGRVVSADRLLVPSSPNWALDAPPSMVGWLRASLRPTQVDGLPRRLYLTRGDVPRTRRYVEEPDLVPALEARGFARVDPGKLSVQEQIDLFSGAEMIVAPHGAALTNVTFSPPGVRVLELFAASYVHLGLWAICQAVGADYRYVVADGPRDRFGMNAGNYDDVSIPVPRVLAEIDRLLA